MQKTPAFEAIFVSDSHLHAGRPQTLEKFFYFLQNQAFNTKQLYLLGDIFEYWVGDDGMDAYKEGIASALLSLCQAGIPVFWISGNRDFLVGAQFAKYSGVQYLPDVSVVRINQRDYALTHGDAHCMEDHEYLAFRAQVRDPRWQENFLAKPLQERRQMAEYARQQSMEKQSGKLPQDLTPAAIEEIFLQTGVDVLIHGHTHQPACHTMMLGQKKCWRYVLPDWEYDVRNPADCRGGWLSIDAAGGVLRFGPEALL